MSATRTIEITADTTQAKEEMRSLREEVERLAKSLQEARSPRISILREPLTYEARLVRDKSGSRGFRAVSSRENRSYIQDFVLAQYKGDTEAAYRLGRHAQEMRKLAEAREAIFHPDVEIAFEERAVNWTNGSGGYFAPPLWINEYYAMQPTPERVLSSLAPRFALPQGAQSVNLPAWTQGVDVEVQQVGAAVPSQGILDQPISSPVATIAGNFDVPMQMLEQSPQGAHLDWMAFSAMEARYGYRLELQMFNGNGTTSPQGSGNQQLLGILNNPLIPAANIVNYSGAGEGSSTGATSMFSAVGQLMAAIGQNRLLPPENWMMTTSRVAWLGSSEDSQARPLMIANSDGSGQFDLIAINVKLNDAIPRTINGNQEPIFAVRPSDWIILESDPRTQVMTEVISGTLQARLQVRRYVAALLRFPTSVAYMIGTGMATAGGF